MDYINVSYKWVTYFRSDIWVTWWISGYRDEIGASEINWVSGERLLCQTSEVEH